MNPGMIRPLGLLLVLAAASNAADARTPRHEQALALPELPRLAQTTLPEPCPQFTITPQGVVAVEDRRARGRQTPPRD